MWVSMLAHPETALTCASMHRWFTSTERGSCQNNERPPLLPSLLTPWNPWRPSLVRCHFIRPLDWRVSHRETNVGECDWTSVTISRTVREPPRGQFQLRIFICPDGVSLGNPSMMTYFLVYCCSGRSWTSFVPVPSRGSVAHFGLRQSKAVVLSNYWDQELQYEKYFHALPAPHFCSSLDQH